MLASWTLHSSFSDAGPIKLSGLTMHKAVTMCRPQYYDCVDGSPGQIVSISSHFALRAYIGVFANCTRPQVRAVHAGRIVLTFDVAAVLELLFYLWLRKRF